MTREFAWNNLHLYEELHSRRKKKKYFNVPAVSYRSAHQRRKVKNSKTNRGVSVDIAKDEQ